MLAGALVSPRSAKKLKLRDFRSLERRVESLSKALTAAQEETQEAKTQLQGVQAANSVVVKGLRDSNAATQAVVQVLQAEKARLAEAEAEARASAEALRAAADAAREEVEALRNESERRCAELTRQAAHERAALLQDVEVAKQTADYRCQDLATSVADLQSTVEQLRADNAKLVAHSRDMEAALEARQNEARASAQAAHADAATASAARRAGEARVSELEAALAKAGDKCDALAGEAREAREAAAKQQAVAAKKVRTLREQLAAERLAVKRAEDQFEQQVRAPVPRCLGAAPPHCQCHRMTATQGSV